MVRPSKRPTNHCWISFSKKVFKGHSKRPKMKVSFYPLPIRFFWKFLHFWNPQVWVSYWKCNIKVVGSLLFLALMLWWAHCISHWVGFAAFSEDRLRLGQNFWAWSNPLKSKELAHMKFGSVSLSMESVASFYMALYF